MTAPQTPGRGAPAGSLTALRTLVDAMHTVAAETAASSPPQAAAQYWWPQAAQYWWTRYEALGEVLHLIDQLDGPKPMNPGDPR